MGKRSAATIRLKERTASSFGYEWTRFSDVFAQYERNFLEYIAPVGREYFKGKVVLDAGCGAGRHAYFAADYGAKKVVAVDLSWEAVIAARNNLGRLSNVDVCQWDIEGGLLEELAGTFDYVFCIGVLHHLANPLAGFNNLVKLLRPGGAISVWVYGRRDNKMALYIYEPLRRITTRLPLKIVLGIAAIGAGMVEVANRLHLPIFKHYAQFSFKTKWNDAFDVLSAPLAQYYTIETVRTWFYDLGLTDVEVSYRLMAGKAKGIRGFGVQTCVG